MMTDSGWNVPQIITLNNVTLETTTKWKDGGGNSGTAHVVPVKHFQGV